MLLRTPVPDRHSFLFQLSLVEGISLLSWDILYFIFIKCIKCGDIPQLEVKSSHSGMTPALFWAFRDTVDGKTTLGSWVTVWPLQTCSTWNTQTLIAVFGWCEMLIYELRRRDRPRGFPRLIAQSETKWIWNQGAWTLTFRPSSSYLNRILEWQSYTRCWRSPGGLSDFQ